MHAGQGYGPPPGHGPPGYGHPGAGPPGYGQSPPAAPQYSAPSGYPPGPQSAAPPGYGAPRSGYGAAPPPGFGAARPADGGYHRGSYGSQHEQAHPPRPGPAAYPAAGHSAPYAEGPPGRHHAAPPVDPGSRGSAVDFAQEKPREYKAFEDMSVISSEEGVHVRLTGGMCLDRHVPDFMACLECWFNRHRGEPKRTGVVWRLVSLELANNKLSDGSLTSVLETLKRLDIRVSRLLLSCNCMRDRGLQALTEYIWNAKEPLTELDISENEVAIGSKSEAARGAEGVSALLRCFYNHSSYPLTVRGHDGAAQVRPLVLRAGGNFLHHPNRLLHDIQDKGGPAHVRICESTTPHAHGGQEYLSVFLPDFAKQRSDPEGRRRRREAKEAAAAPASVPAAIPHQNGLRQATQQPPPAAPPMDARSRSPPHLHRGGPPGTHAAPLGHPPLGHHPPPSVHPPSPHAPPPHAPPPHAPPAHAPPAHAPPLAAPPPGHYPPPPGHYPPPMGHYPPPGMYPPPGGYPPPGYPPPGYPPHGRPPPERRREGELREPRRRERPGIGSAPPASGSVSQPAPAAGSKSPAAPEGGQTNGAAPAAQPAAEAPQALPQEAAEAAEEPAEEPTAAQPDAADDPGADGVDFGGSAPSSPGSPCRDRSRSRSSAGSSAARRKKALPQEGLVLGSSPVAAAPQPAKVVETPAAAPAKPMPPAAGDQQVKILDEAEQKVLQQAIGDRVDQIEGLPSDEATRDMLSEFVVCMVVARKSANEINAELHDFLGAHSTTLWGWLVKHVESEYGITLA